jgi:hypothetical protein
LADEFGQFDLERLALRRREYAFAQFGAQFFNGVDGHDRISGRREAGPALRRSPLAGASVPVRPGPDQLEAFRTFDLDQSGVDRSREARIVQLDGEVVALGVFGGLLPGGAQLDVARVDAEVRSLVGWVVDADQLGLDVEVERLDGAGEAIARGGEGADGSHCLSPLVFSGRAYRDLDGGRETGGDRPAPKGPK